MAFVSKYRPLSTEEYIGQRDGIIEFKRWIVNWKPREGKALLLYGPPGVGKTALVEAWCAENKLDLIQLNASDYRSAADIKNSLGQSAQQVSLFRRGKVFLIDEIDGLAGQEDRGGAAEIIEIIKKSAHPIVMTANDPWDPKLRSLRTHCKLIEFKKLPTWDIEKKLQLIAEKEGIQADKESIRMISTRAKGDMRAGINDFEILSTGQKTISVGSLESLGFREREENIFEVLRMVFKTQTALGAKMAVSQAEKDPDEIFWWIENNITKEFENPQEIAAAYEALSKADMFRQGVRLRQYWTLKSYMIDMMTAGVSMAKKNVYRKFTRYEYPRNIMILGRTKVTRKLKMEILQKLAGNFHCSTAKVRSDYLPYLQIAAKSLKFKRRFMESFNLSKDETAELFSK